MTTRIVCHRGACRHAPENTIASGLTAARLGGDIVELDVRQSRDGVLYVLHDATVDRTTDGAGAIAEMHSAELDRLDAGAWFGPEFSGEPLARLGAFFAALKDRTGFYVEVKVADADKVADAIRRAGIGDRCFTYSETADMRDAMRAAAPWLKRMVNWRDLRAIAEAHDRGAAILEFHAPDFTAGRLAEARAEGLEIMVHTPLEDRAVFRAALAAGVEYLNIDYPDIAAQLRSELP
jgi:glycerophosphoryl diester phosphodiesterase